MLSKGKTLILIFLLFFIIGMVLFLWPWKVEMFGEVYPLNTSVLNLTGVQVDYSKDWPAEFGKLPYLKVVKFDGQNLSPEIKKRLHKLYPKVQFEIVNTIYTLKVHDNVKKLDLSNIKVDDELLKYLNLFTDLKKVIITSEMDQELQFKLVKKYPNITFDWPVKIADNVVSSLEEELDLSGSKIADLDSFKKSLSLLPRLKTLDMSYTNLSNEELGQMREEFPNTKISWVIRMGKWSLRTDAVSFSVLIFDFTHVRLKAKDIEVLKYCTDLRALDVGHQAIEDISVIGEYLTELRVLILSDNQISDISPLKNLKHLHYLEFFMNRVSDLTPLAELKGLVDLNIGYNYNISDITPLLDLPKLERLWLIATKTTTESFNKLYQRYPDAIIIRYGDDGSTGNGWRAHPRYFAMIDMYLKTNYISDEFTKYD